MAMMQRPPPPKPKMGFVAPVVEEPLKKPREMDRCIIHRSPRNPVELYNGVLSKKYDYVSEKTGMISGEFIRVRFSDDHFSYTDSSSSCFSRAFDGHPDNAPLLAWFKSDIRRATELNSDIRKFVLSYPGVF